ncbi:MAG TPA: YdcH family protein [Azonexus sp.]|nr:YdcH family protein [Azonexus sp.]
MQVDHHDLHQDFPEFNEAIQVLKAGNAHFARLFASYTRLTGKVEDLEEHDMPVADFTMEDMKKQRVKLKDELYHMLLAFRAGQQYAKA